MFSIGVSVIAGSGDERREAVGSGVLIARVAVGATVGVTRVSADWQATTNDARPITIPIRCTNLLRNEVIVTLFCE
jgi:hypothetical protein